MDDEYIKRGTADILYGHRCEQLGEYQKAFDLYLSGVEILLSGAHADKNLARQEHVRKKVLDYMQAAERLKAKIPPPSSPNSSRRGSASSSAPNPSDHHSHPVGPSQLSPSATPSASPSILRKEMPSSPAASALSSPSPHHTQPSVHAPSSLHQDASSWDTASSLIGGDHALNAVHHQHPHQEVRHVHFAPSPPQDLRGNVPGHGGHDGFRAREIPSQPSHTSFLQEFDPLAPAAPHSQRTEAASENQAPKEQPRMYHEDGTLMGSVSVSEESVKHMVDLVQQIMRNTQKRPEDTETRFVPESEIKEGLRSAESVNRTVSAELGRVARMSPEEEKALEDEFDALMKDSTGKGESA